MQVGCRSPWLTHGQRRAPLPFQHPREGTISRPYAPVPAAVLPPAGSACPVCQTAPPPAAQEDQRSAGSGQVERRRRPHPAVAHIPPCLRWSHPYRLAYFFLHGCRQARAGTAGTGLQVCSQALSPRSATSLQPSSLFHCNGLRWTWQRRATGHARHGGLGRPIALLRHIPSYTTKDMKRYVPPSRRGQGGEAATEQRGLEGATTREPSQVSSGW